MSKIYEPYGPEWGKAMMKHTKKELIDILKDHLQEICPVCKETIDLPLFCEKCRNA